MAAEVKVCQCWYSKRDRKLRVRPLRQAQNEVSGVAAYVDLRRTHSQTKK